MRKTGWVSVVIPCYNAERFLGETLESALAQTYPSLEIIVIDDGSTDRSAEVLRSYASRVRVERTPNQGASAARNRGTALAQGEFIQYLDADDLLRPKAVGQRVQALQQSGADVAYSDYQRLEENAEGVFQRGTSVARRLEDVHSDPVLAFLTDFWVPPAALLYRRTLVERIGSWNESLPVIQDARFALDAALCGARFIYVPGVSADHRIQRQDRSLSRRNRAAFVRDVFANASQVQALWEKDNVLTPERQNALARVYDFTARELLAIDYLLFRDNLQRLCAMQPGFRMSWPRVAGVLARWTGPFLAQKIIALGKRPAGVRV